MQISQRTGLFAVVRATILIGRISRSVDFFLN